MDNPLYVQLTRQSGLLKEMDMIATNIANMSTPGFRREGAIFSEYVQQTDDRIGSLSMTAARTRYADEAQGPLRQTGSPFDFAIEGEGFFQLQGPDGPLLSRSGAFTLSPEGQLVGFQGHAVLDQGGAPVQLPPDFATLAVSPDGVVSADGRVVGEIGLVRPTDPRALRREGGSLFAAEGALEPALGSRITQGFIESSNVNAVEEITRMIEVQRSYELGASLVERSDELARSVIQTMGEPNPR